MDKFSIPLQAQPYVDALRSLVRSGASISPSLEESPLTTLPFVVAEAGANASQVRRADLFVTILERVIRKRLRGNDQRVALILFAYDEYAGLSLGDRHSAVAKIRNKRNWDQYRKEPLDRDLLMVYLALYRESEIEVSETTVTADLNKVMSSPRPSAHNLLVGGNYVTNFYESISIFPNAPDEPYECVQVREIMASSDGVEAWRQDSKMWGAKNSSQHPRIHLFGAGNLSVNYDQESSRLPGPGRVYITEVKFPRPLKRGEQARFILHKQWLVAFDKLTRKGWRDQASLLGITIPIHYATIGVRFPKDLRPANLWHFENMPTWLGPGVATEVNRIEPDSFGFVRYSWQDLAVGYSYGVAWEW
jgi:hypothetical protein